MSQVWLAAMDQTNDDDLAFHMGIENSVAALRTASLIMQSSATVEEAFKQGIKYSKLIANVFDMRLGQDTDNVSIEFQRPTIASATNQ